MGIAKCIMGFAGHMIDQPSRSSPRFPESVESKVRAAIRDALLRYQPQIAVSSAACGGDIIFAEEALNLNIPTYIILPFEDKEEFIKMSVICAGEHWRKRFHAICSKSKRVCYVRAGGYTGEKDFEGNQHAVVFFTLGFSEAVNMQIMNLILYDDTQPGDGPGGTKSFLDLCKGLERLGFDILYEVIDLAKIRNQVTNL